MSNARPDDGIRRDCTHGGRHEHGTKVAYNQDRCRCRPCRDAEAAYARARTRALAYGQWDVMVDAQPAREHVAALREAHLGIPTIAKLSGVSSSRISALVYGDPKRPCRKLTSRTSSAILAVPIPGDRVGRADCISSLGTVRRLRALCALGYTPTLLAGHIDMLADNLGRLVRAPGEGVTEATRAAVVALYDRLSMAQPPRGWRADRARAKAVAEAWPPPLAWDDEDLDDPKARPFLPGQGRRGPSSTYGTEEARALLDSGLTLQEVALRFNVQPDSVAKRLKRAQERGEAA